MLFEIITTIQNRPYVVLFLLSYLYIAIKVTNARWTFLFFIAGYTIAFISEYLSIHYGFPYGWYFYKYQNLQGEWFNHGVPVWDSASYVFMNFAGLFAAWMALKDKKSNLTLIFLSAFFVTLLDVVVDPVSHMGKRWFLGEIYSYPDPGFYFDVPFTNFVGWFLTSLLINSVGVYGFGFSELIRVKGKTFLGLGLYFGIFCFGLAIAVYLQEWKLVLCDLFWIGISIILIYRKV